MRKRTLNNKAPDAIDAIGRSLIEAGKISDPEIDDIVLAPELYSKIRARIGSGRQAVKGPRFALLSPWTGAAFGSALLALAGIIGFAYLTEPEPAAHGALASEISETMPVPTRPAAPPEPPTMNDVTDRAPESKIRVERVAVPRPRKRPAPMPEKIVESRPEPEFYALTYAGDPYETARGGRVIRVDMPRSSLFAMGVDLPLENEPESVMADLLIGPDGVARAIRIVR
jgi:hypothetical protein